MTALAVQRTLGAGRDDDGPAMRAVDARRQLEANSRASAIRSATVVSDAPHAGHRTAWREIVVRQLQRSLDDMVVMLEWLPPGRDGSGENQLGL